MLPTKKMLSFNHYLEGSLIPLKVNDIEFPESASFRLLEQASQRFGSHTLNLRPFYTSI